jgi:GWxTD domain-containing protein
MPLGCLANLPAGQIECILIHELAHIRRHDYLVNLLQSFVEGLLFYHPAVWWASRVAREERENCCDDVVVELTGDARVYAATLAALEHRRALALQAAVAANGGSLMKRIRRLLAQPHPARVSATPAFAAGLLLVTFGAALAAWPAKPPARRIIPAVALQARILESQTVEPQSSPLTGALLLRQDKPQTVRQPLATPYQKWLNEDVTYIITDKERASYVGLQTDEEREHFIEQFWLRRDPTPGTVGNEYREEHYRRIAYANEHFADPNLPGWKTDRGRIYITYGPPDEIEDHSAGGSYQRPASEGGGTTSTFPFQQWRYRYIEGIGNNVIVEFVDPTMRGEFHMTMDPSEKDALLHVPNAARTAKVFHSDQDPRVSVATGGAQTDSTNDATPYSIAAGDVIGVKIWEDPRFSSNYTVRPDGRISVPLLGDISAAGLTPVQLESAINQAALKFLQVAHTAVQIEHGAQRPANAANRLNALVITIGPATGQYYITAEVTGITGRTVQVVAEAVQSSPPGTFFKWLALPPGNHILRVSIRDPNGVSKSSETRFTVD